MTSLTDEFVETDVGRLHVLRRGTGPVTILWHSLFLDSRSWVPLIGALAELVPDRTIIAVDGPSHGRSEPLNRDFTFDECAQAAANVLDRIGVDEPVDWVGNAWGGHVGIVLAAGQPKRIRTLTTIGTPVHGTDTDFVSRRAGLWWRCIGSSDRSNSSAIRCRKRYWDRTDRPR